MSLEKQAQRFVETLEALGGSAGNGRLGTELGWADSTYQRVKAHLIDEGRIVPGRGRGGSVALAGKAAPAPKTTVASALPSKRSRDGRSGNGRNGDSNGYSQAFNSIDKAMRNDEGLASELDYAEQTSWLLFLKYLDDMEHEWADEAALKGKSYAPLLTRPYRWQDWAAPKTTDGKPDPNARTGVDLIEFVNGKLIPHLKSGLPSGQLWKCRARRGGERMTAPRDCSDDYAHFHMSQDPRRWRQGVSGPIIEALPLGTAMNHNLRGRKPAQFACFLTAAALAVCSFDAKPAVYAVSSVPNPRPELPSLAANVVALGDLNGDGVSELIAPGDNGPFHDITVSVLDVATETEVRRVAASRGSPRALRAMLPAKDVNGDGKPDIFLAYYADVDSPFGTVGKVIWEWIDAATGVSISASEFSGDNNDTQGYPAAFVPDANSDGRDDLLNLGGQILDAVSGAVIGSTGLSQSSLRDYVRAVSDQDMDGVFDLVHKQPCTGSTGNYTCTFGLYSGSDFSQIGSVHMPSGVNTRLFSLADVDADGKVEVLMAAATSSTSAQIITGNFDDGTVETVVSPMTLSDCRIHWGAGTDSEELLALPAPGLGMRFLVTGISRSQLVDPTGTALETYRSYRFTSYDPAIPDEYGRCVPWAYTQDTADDVYLSITRSLGDIDGDGLADSVASEMASDRSWIEVYRSTGDSIAPSAPTLTASVRARQVLLDWEATDASTAYVIVQRAIEDEAFEDLADTVTRSPFVDDAVAVGTTYRYRLAAADRSHNRGTPSVEAVVLAANNAPVAEDDAFVKGEVWAVRTSVASNDSDLDDDPLTYMLVTAPTNGTAVLSPPGDLLYTPVGGFIGADVLQYTVEDAYGDMDTGTVTIDVTVPNATRHVVAGGTAITGLSRAPGGELVATTEGQSVLRLRPNLSLKHTVSLGDSAISAAAMHEDGTTFLAGSDAFLYAFGDSGASVDGWPRAVGSLVAYTMAVAEDGAIFVCPQNGVLQVIELDNRLRGTLLLDSACASAPVLFPEHDSFAVLSANGELTFASMSTINAATGELAIIRRLHFSQPPASTLSGGEQDVYWLSSDGHLNAVPAQVDEAPRVSAEPLLMQPVGEILTRSDGSVVVAGTDGTFGQVCSISALLSPEWCVPTNVPAASPMLDPDGNVIVIVVTGTLFHLSGADGTSLATVQVADAEHPVDPTHVSAEPLFDGRYALLADSGGAVVSVHMDLLGIISAKADSESDRNPHWSGARGGQMRNGRAEQTIEGLDSYFRDGFEGL